MRTHLGLVFLWKRAAMRRREKWSREQLLSFQAEQLAKLRTHALAHSPFYRKFHEGLENAPLAELPVLTKTQLTANFDEIVTSPKLTKQALDEHVANRRAGTLFRGHWVCATSGSSGQHAVIPYGFFEWAAVLASHSRVNDWAKIRWRPRRLRIGIVGAQSRWHLSAAASHTMRSLFLRIRRWSPADPLHAISGGLSAEQPDVLVALAGMVPALVEEAKAGRLMIAPQAVICVAELLTPSARRAVRETWGVEPFDMYAATETAGIGAECGCHEGLHLYEDLIIPEVVDEKNRPVPPGTPGAKLLVTVLYSRTVPLIRYQLDDSVTLDTELCSCGRPFHRLSRIEGRVAQTLRFACADGTTVALHPIRFATNFDTLNLTGWQVVKEGNRLTILIARPVSDAVLERVGNSTQQLMRESGIANVDVRVEAVDAIPRHKSGKVILVQDKSELVDA